MPVRVYVDDVSQHKDVPAEQAFRDWVSAVFAERINGEIGVRIVSEEEGRALNRQYRGRDYPTNVLSFPGGDAPQIDEVELPIGDIVLCAGVIEREAIEFACPPLARWAHMTVHGALHLDGFDHETQAQAQVMESAESRLMRHLGFEDPWSSADTVACADGRGPAT